MNAIQFLNQKAQHTNTPLPKQTNSNEILIRVELASLCRTDIAAAKGEIPISSARILGHEFIGRIAKQNKESPHFKINDRVSALPYSPNLKNMKHLGIDYDGCFAEYVFIPSDQLVKIPESIEQKAACYFEPFSAACSILDLKIPPKSKVLIWGKNRFAFCLQLLLQDHLENSLQFADNPKDLSDQKNQFDVVIETEGWNTQIHHWIESLKPKGHLILRSRYRGNILIPALELQRKRITIQSCWYASSKLTLEKLNDHQNQLSEIFGPSFYLKDFSTALAWSENHPLKKTFLEIS